MEITFGFALTLMFIVAAVGGVLALVDGVIRARGGAAVLAVVEIIVAVLFLLSLFIKGFPIVIGGAEFTTPLLALILVIILLIQLALRGTTRRGGVALTLIAIILLVIWFVFGDGARVNIPGVNA
ncbi:MAG: hypothetical protein ABIR17_04215 [Pseudolysinimonas sp.]|uniref:hypothetical protein n=1 Tax=Pseudolysinimonas sp. TaxID=2680009 RepID=UPI0032635D9E